MKLIIAIFEGADFDILSSLMKSNLLPNFQKLNNFNKCSCSFIPYEASGLMSIFSGLAESDHGISSYWRAQNAEYIPKLWNSNDVKSNMIWNKSEYKNIRTSIINLWGTYPAYPINGFLLSYSMEKSLRYSFPSELSKELFKDGYHYVQDTCAIHNKSTNKEVFCRDVLKIDMLRKNCIEYFEKKTDIIIVNFTAIDRISHFYFDEYWKERTNSILFRAYLQCDNILGELMTMAERNDASLISFSEIGFGRLKNFFSINHELSRHGLLRYELDGSIDWNKTLAFESVQGTHGININRKHKNINGIVDDIEYPIVLWRTIEVLSQFKNPNTGFPYFKSVMPGKEFYNQQQNIPDIIVDPYDEEYLPYGDPYWANYLGRDLQTGWHRRNGFYGYLSKYSFQNRNIMTHELYDLLDSHFRRVSVP